MLATETQGCSAS